MNWNLPQHLTKNQKKTPLQATGTFLFSNGDPGGGLCEHLAHSMPRLLLRCGWAGCLTFLGDSLQLLNHKGLRPPWRGSLPRFSILEGPLGDSQSCLFPQRWEFNRRIVIDKLTAVIWVWLCIRFFYKNLQKNCLQGLALEALLLAADPQPGSNHCLVVRLHGPL